MDALTSLKVELREGEVPYFTDEELTYFLNKNGNDIKATLYECALLKSEDSSLKVSGLTTNDTSKYFLRIAQKYRYNHSGTLGG